MLEKRLYELKDLIGGECTGIEVEYVIDGMPVRVSVGDVKDLTPEEEANFKTYTRYIPWDMWDEN
jgi:hypothetical protein